MRAILGDPNRKTPRRAARALGVCTFLLGALLIQAADAGRTTRSTLDRIPTPNGDLVVYPIHHATLALEWNRKTVCIDPVGGAGRFAGLPKPDLILITHTHGDHFDPATLDALGAAASTIVAPPAVAEKLPAPLRGRTTVLTNGANATAAGIRVEAVAAYNATPERKNYHARGQGNGYVLSFDACRVYVSGDTEDIPEMRALKGIDVAFICMNLPYTMTVEQAASAVAAFQPRIVYPYHSRGSDLDRFKESASKTAGVEVRLRNWYPN